MTHPLNTLNSAYNEVAFNEKSPITKENLCTKYTTFTYKYIALNEKPPIMKQNVCIFFFVIGRVECIPYMEENGHLKVNVGGLTLLACLPLALSLV